MICEICGKRKATAVVEIEGAEMNSCFVCGKNAKFIRKLGEEREEVKEEVKPIEEGEEEIVDNYGEIIKKARVEKGLSLEELAKKINERESYLRHVEREEMMPNEKLIKKLEKELGINLKEKASYSPTNVKVGKKEEETLMDIADIEGDLDGS